MSYSFRSAALLDGARHDVRKRANQAIISMVAIVTGGIATLHIVFVLPFYTNGPAWGLRPNIDIDRIGITFEILVLIYLTGMFLKPATILLYAIAKYWRLRLRLR